MKYLKKFNTHSEYENARQNLILPNVSLIEETHGMAYTPLETRVVAKFNVTNISSTTPIGYYQYTSGFSAIEIDGVVQPSVVSAYTFSTTGEHTVKYTLKDPTSIGERAFQTCTGLTSINIPNSVTSIGERAFQTCTGLTSCTIGSGVTSIGTSAFTSCISLLSINIPSSVTSIGDSAFYQCRSLTSITIPSGVTSIGSGAFGDCRSLPIVDNIRYADTYAIEVIDRKLSTYTLKNDTRFIGNNVFYQCSSLTSVTIPDSVTSIGERAFQLCTSLTSINIPNSVTSIGMNAFGNCSGLTSIEIPNSVTSIGNAAFGSCSGLTSCTIGSGVTSIGSNAFLACRSLTSITCYAVTAPTIYNTTFSNVNAKGGTLYVTIGSSGYDTWMQNSPTYLGYYKWKKVEQ